MGRLLSPKKFLIFLSKCLVVGFLAYLMYPDVYSHTLRFFYFITSDNLNSHTDDYIIIDTQEDFKDSYRLSISEDRILSSGHNVEHHLNEDGDPKKLCPLVPSTLVGYKQPNTTPLASLEEVGMTLNAEGSPLHWQPLHCRPRHLVAILVPLRNRTAHLLTFLRHMHPFLQRQQIAYRVFVIEQSDKGKFNRAKLLNVGFVEAMSALSTTERKLDCVVFHDVDHLPEDDRNLYICPQSPEALQLAVSVDTDNYTVAYTNFFGAVSAMNPVTFKAVNGYSNMYWGWGGEDDDMAERLQSVGVRIVRSADAVGRYTTLAHHPQIRSLARWEILDRALRRKDFDGLGSLHYKRLALKQTSLMTHILVDLVSIN